MRTTMDGTRINAQDPECIQVGVNPIDELAKDAEQEKLTLTFEGIDVVELPN